MATESQPIKCESKYFMLISQVFRIYRWATVRIVVSPPILIIIKAKCTYKLNTLVKQIRHSWHWNATLPLRARCNRFI
jgi:hypothetical protein